MSLLTDIIFVEAIQSNRSLLGRLAAGDVYNTAIALPDDDIDNAPIPYVIVTFDGMTNDTGTKDTYEGDTDQVRIGVTIAANTRQELGEIALAVRTTIRDYFTALMEGETVSENMHLLPYDYTVSAGPVQYDSLNPCMWQVLNYACETGADDED